MGGGQGRLHSGGSQLLVKTTGEKLQFLQIACGSLAEVGYCLHAAKRPGYIEESVYLKLELRVRRTSAPLRGLMKSMGREHP